MNKEKEIQKEIEESNSAYIFASCKPWHKPSFNTLSEINPGKWIYVENPDDLNKAITRQQPRYIFFLHWNWMVPEEIWKTYECVCFHMTDVPYGRGGSPLQNLILAGHTETKLTALKMIQEMDAGPVYAKIPMKLDGSAEEIYIRAGEISIALIEWILKNNPTPTPQQGEPFLFKRRKPEQSEIPKSGSLSSIYDFIRMLDAKSYPNAFIKHGEFLIKFRNAEMKNNELTAEVVINFKNNLK